MHRTDGQELIMSKRGDDDVGFVRLLSALAHVRKLP